MVIGAASFGNLEIIGIALIMLFAWAILVEPLWIEKRVLTLEIPNLPPELDGLRLAFVSDTHCGAWSKRRFFNRAWHWLSRHNPDILLLGGDVVVSHARSSWLDDLSGLSGWNPPLGKFAVLGGHDRTYNPLEVSDGLRQIGVTVLCNESVRFERQGKHWWLTGLADNSDYPMLCNAPLALQEVPAAEPALALVHSPDFALTPEAGRFSLILSGHTHAGQVRVPWLGAPQCVTALPRANDHGFTHPCGLNLFVTRGLGCTVRLRFCCRPEVCLLILKRTVA